MVSCTRDLRWTRRSALHSGAALLASPLVSRIARAAPSLVDGVLFYGQSNAGSGGPSTARRALAPLSQHSLSFVSAEQTYGERLLDPKTLRGLAPLVDQPGRAVLPATTMAYALDRSGGSDETHFFHSVWFGSQPLSAFMPGTACWHNLSAVAERMASTLTQAGRQSRVDAVVFIQGESGPSDRATYRRMLEEMVLEGLPSLNGSDASKPPLLIVVQTNASTANPHFATGVPMAQWDAARTLRRLVTLAGPAYQCPLSDGVHHSTEGRMMLGDLLALVYDIQLRQRGDFQPLQPREVTHAADSIIVTFSRPSESLALQWDEDWIPPAPNYGFQVLGSGKPITIDSVRISGPSEVTIKLDRTPSSRDLEVRYAMDRNDAPGWSPGRGQLIAPTTRTTAFRSIGAAIPEKISHYAIRFEVAIPY